MEIPCTYDELEWGDETDVRSAAYRKVEQFSERASHVSMQIQTESMLNASEDSVNTEEESVVCPNSWKARKENKQKRLDKGATLIGYCRALVKKTAQVLRFLIPSINII